MSSPARQRVVLITGASSGIGKICAEHLQRLGYRVYGTSRRVLKQTPFQPLMMDVTSDTSVEAAVQLILAREGRLDIVVNNAGEGIAGAIEDTSIDEARQQFETNFFGVMRVCRAVLPAMRTQGSGLIVNVSSIGGLVGLPFQGLYSASKFAIEGFTETLRMEVRPFGIHAVLIEPGDFRTGFTAQRRRVRNADSAAYGARFSKALATMERDEQLGGDPRQVALALTRIIREPHPRLRFKVATLIQSLAGGLLRALLPQRLYERLIMIAYDIA